ncbi:MAG: hypothetical protein N2Z23_01580 [Pyrinomonadaceae bacterium]|nr:hypothetical protein [Pyrinomonadaceae bacterium]MCX7639121.1 hypothetical protein [Pyrinomonadaceae bacterium]MDW8303658.1 hypothetical protein [Acidobacteriota bacterium]
MSFTLIDLGKEGYEFHASIWHWKPTLEIIRSLDIISGNKLRLMESNGNGVKVEEEEARLIGKRIYEEILPKLEPNKRIFVNLTITDEPDDGTFYRAPEEQWKNYSVNYQWLKDFADFCLQSKGFQVF